MCLTRHAHLSPEYPIGRRYKKPRHRPGLFLYRGRLSGKPKAWRKLTDLAEVAEFLVEAADAATAVEDLRAAARPGRMRGRIDVQNQRVAFRAVGRTRLEGGAIRHGHGDRVVVGMRVFLHSSNFSDARGKRSAANRARRRMGAYSESDRALQATKPVGGLQSCQMSLSPCEQIVMLK